MLSLQELSDRVELEQLSTRYANAIDSGNWDDLDQVFTADAYIDYRALGGIDGRYPRSSSGFPRCCRSFRATAIWWATSP